MEKISAKLLAGSFAQLKGVAPGARYLAILMLQKGYIGWQGQSWSGGLIALASSVDYSKQRLASALAVLVDSGVLLASKKKTNGRPLIVYSLGTLTLKETSHDFPAVLIEKILDSQCAVFDGLSIAERCVLAQMWLKLWETRPLQHGFYKPRMCVLEGVSCLSLATDLGISKSSAVRLIAELRAKSYIHTSDQLCAIGKVVRNKAYFLLGEKIADGRRAEIKACGVLAWLCGEEDVFDPGQFMTSFEKPLPPGRSAQEIGRVMRPLQDLNERYDLLICLCSAVSNGLLGTVNQMYAHVQLALLRVFNIRIFDNDLGFSGIEFTQPEVFGDCNSDLIRFVEYFSGYLVDALKVHVYEEFGVACIEDMYYCLSVLPVRENGRNRILISSLSV